MQEALRLADVTASAVRAIGVANQRETTIIFDKKTGVAACRGISWNCTRTVDIAAQFRRRHSHWVTGLTGLPIGSYFSATKLAWLFKSMPELRENESFIFGTIDTFLLFHLTGEFATDVTNASRTLLCNIHSLTWDDRLLELFGVPKRMLARVEPSVGGAFGTIKAEGPFSALAGVPVTCVLGDQSAAAFGQCCFEPGDVKATLGTGAFVMVNTGPSAVFASRGLLTTPLYQIADQPPVYALEGAIAVAGTAIQWLRDNMGLAVSAQEIADLAAKVDNAAGVILVPAFNGLFAPHWDETARGCLLGLTSFADKRHVALAALEAVAFQLDELCRSFATGFGRPFKILKFDGGMAKNTQLLQICANILDLPGLRPKVLETTAAGAAFGAGLAVNSFVDLEDLKSKTWRPHQIFNPNLDATDRDQLRARWAKAIRRTKGWEDPCAPHIEDHRGKGRCEDNSGRFCPLFFVSLAAAFLAGILVARRH